MITRGNPQTHRNSPESSRQEWNVGAKISCSCEFVVKTTQIRYKNYNPVSHKSSRNYSSSQTKLPLSPSPWALYLKPSNPHMFKLSQRLPWQESSQDDDDDNNNNKFTYISTATSGVGGLPGLLRNLQIYSSSLDGNCKSNTAKKNGMWIFYMRNLMEVARHAMRSSTQRVHVQPDKVLETRSSPQVLRWNFAAGPASLLAPTFYCNLTADWQCWRLQYRGNYTLKLSLLFCEHKYTVGS